MPFVLQLTPRISRYKVSVESSPPHAAVGPAAKISIRSFFFEVQAGDQTVCAGVLPRAPVSHPSNTLALCACVPLASSSLQHMDITIRLVKKTRWGLRKVVAECKSVAVKDESSSSLPLNASTILNQPTCKLQCKGLQLLNVLPSGTSPPGSLCACVFDADIALTPGVTGNFFEGQSAPSVWTGTNVEVQV